MRLIAFDHLLNIFDNEIAQGWPEFELEEKDFRATPIEVESIEAELREAAREVKLLIEPETGTKYAFNALPSYSKGAHVALLDLIYLRLKNNTNDGHFDAKGVPWLDGIDPIPYFLGFITYFRGYLYGFLQKSTGIISSLKNSIGVLEETIEALKSVPQSGSRVDAMIKQLIQEKENLEKDVDALDRIVKRKYDEISKYKDILTDKFISLAEAARLLAHENVKANTIYRWLRNHLLEKTCKRCGKTNFYLFSDVVEAACEYVSNNTSKNFCYEREEIISILTPSKVPEEKLCGQSMDN